MISPVDDFEIFLKSQRNLSTGIVPKKKYYPEGAVGNERKFAIYLITYEMEENMIDVVF
jgi:hypothetical protein